MTRIGHWEYCSHHGGFYICSNCGHEQGVKSDFCQDCGSCMKDDHTEWIDVNKKLPRIGKRVLVTAYGRVCYAMLHSPDGNNGYPIFLLQDSLKERVVCETTSHSEFTEGRITAWMPLPTPYGEEQSK